MVGGGAAAPGGTVQRKSVTDDPPMAYEVELELLRAKNLSASGSLKVSMGAKAWAAGTSGAIGESGGRVGGAVGEHKAALKLAGGKLSTKLATKLVKAGLEMELPAGLTVKLEGELGGIDYHKVKIDVLAVAFKIEGDVTDLLLDELLDRPELTQQLGGFTAVIALSIKVTLAEVDAGNILASLAAMHRVEEAAASVDALAPEMKAAKDARAATQKRLARLTGQKAKARALKGKLATLDKELAGKAKKLGALKAAVKEGVEEIETLALELKSPVAKALARPLVAKSLSVLHRVIPVIGWVMLVVDVWETVKKLESIFSGESTLDGKGQGDAPEEEQTGAGGGEGDGVHGDVREAGPDEPEMVVPGGHASGDAVHGAAEPVQPGEERGTGQQMFDLPEVKAPNARRILDAMAGLGGEVTPQMVKAVLAAVPAELSDDQVSAVIDGLVEHLPAGVLWQYDDLVTAISKQVARLGLPSSPPQPGAPAVGAPGGGTGADGGVGNGDGRPVDHDLDGAPPELVRLLEAMYGDPAPPQPAPVPGLPAGPGGPVAPDGRVPGPTGPEQTPSAPVRDGVVAPQPARRDEQPGAPQLDVGTGEVETWFTLEGESLRFNERGQAWLAANTGKLTIRRGGEPLVLLNMLPEMKPAERGAWDVGLHFVFTDPHGKEQRIGVQLSLLPAATPGERARLKSRLSFDKVKDYVRWTGRRPSLADGAKGTIVPLDGIDVEIIGMAVTEATEEDSVMLTLKIVNVTDPALKAVRGVEVELGKELVLEFPASSFAKRD